MINGYALRSFPFTRQRLDTMGVDWGPKGIIMLYRERDWASYKIPGHMAWTDNFAPWHWEGARYGILKIIEDDSEGYWGRIELEHRLEIKPDKFYIAAAKKLKDDVRKLANGTTTIEELINV